MIFKYRVIGRAKSQFGFRGMVFESGAKIDFCIKKGELDFIKEYCDIEQVIDFGAKEIIDLPNAMLDKKETESEKGVDNAIRKRNNQGKHKKNI